jgi:hypothetical protein
MNKDIAAYNNKVESPELKAVCDHLAKVIDATMPKTVTSKISYAQPIWFLGANPLVGYNVTKKGKVNLLFWSGQAFEEPGLTVEGSFKAAEIKYETVGDIDEAKLKKWLKEAAVTMYDYMDIRKNKGKLTLMKAGK